jgi:hypothetical protein
VASNPGFQPENGDVMPQTIARIYGNQEAAAAAVRELRERGFNADAIHSVAQPEAPETTLEGAGTPSDAVRESIMQAGVAPEHARIYAEHVSRGAVLVVVVDPPFGFARAAMNILDSHNPTEVDLPQAAPPPAAAATTWRSATPLSSWLGWRVLSDDPAPLSNLLNQPVLKSEPESSPTLERIRQQSRDAAPLSAKVGMPVRLDNPAPLSARFGWRLLLEKAAPLSERFGWRLLWDDPTPLSTRFGWRTLSDNPTPLSSCIGWKVLSDK